MRTTIDIPDSLYRQLKTKAAREKRSVKELVLRGVEAELQLRRTKKKGHVALPLIRSKWPGRLEVSNARIYDLISFP